MNAAGRTLTVNEMAAEVGDTWSEGLPMAVITDDDILWAITGVERRSGDVLLTVDAPSVGEYWRQMFSFVQDLSAGRIKPEEAVIEARQLLTELPKVA